MFVATLIAQKDAAIVRDTFVKAGAGIIVHHFTDNLLFIDFLNKSNRFPDVIILDVDSLLYDGLEVLATIKSRLYWSKIPTIVFSGGINKSNKEKFISLGANFFYQKPSDPHSYNQMITEVLDKFYSVKKSEA